VYKIPTHFWAYICSTAFLGCRLGERWHTKSSEHFAQCSVFPCNISSTAVHVLLSQADGQIGDMKNLPTAIAWQRPWATGDNWSEISDQTGETSKFTQLETVYTDLCKRRPVMLPSFVQSHSDAHRSVLFSNYSLISWEGEVFQLFHFLLALLGLQEQNWIRFSSGGAEPAVFHLFCLPNRWTTTLLLVNLLSQQGNMSQSPEGNGLEVFSYFLVSSGGGKINFCHYAFNLTTFNHSI